MFLKLFQKVNLEKKKPTYFMRNICSNFLNHSSHYRRYMQSALHIKNSSGWHQLQFKVWANDKKITSLV